MKRHSRLSFKKLANSGDKLSNSGFSLVEVIVALVILAVLSLLTANAMRSGIQNRDMVAGDIAREAKLSDAMRIIHADITTAYHFRDIFVTMLNEINAPATPTPNPQNPDQPVQPINPAPAAEGAPTPKPTPPQVTGFVGDSESMYFTTLSNARTLRDSHESDQAKIGYFVKSCNAGTGEKKYTTKCLYRAISPYLDLDVTKAGPETLLLEGVEEFKLRYLGPGHEDFLDAWKTGKDGDPTTRENFPYAVEVTITTHIKNDPKDKPLTASALIPIRFPNNPPSKKTPKVQQ